MSYKKSVVLCCIILHLRLIPNVAETQYTSYMVLQAATVYATARLCFDITTIDVDLICLDVHLTL